MKHGDFRGARRDLTLCAESGREDAALYTVRALASELLGEYQAALADVELALALAPRSKSLPEAKLRLQRRIAELEPKTVIETIHAAHPWEKQAARRLQRELKGVDGTILLGASLPHHRHGRINVDLVLICDRGVFVMECKSYGGRIEGGANSPWSAAKSETKIAVKSERGVNPLFQVEEQVFALLGRIETLAAQRPNESMGRVWVNGCVLFPENAAFDLGTVSADRFEGNAISAFHVTALGAAIRAKSAASRGILSKREGRKELVEWLKR
jgi:hypothetical protein